MDFHTYSNHLIQLEKNDYSYLKELFIQWYKKQNKIKLNNKELEILKYFIFDEFDSSPYKCYKYLKDNKIIKLDVTNVRIKVEKLHKLCLLEEKPVVIKNGRRHHNATFYKLSSFGVFYILKEGFLNKVSNPNLDIIIKYKNYKLYDIILYRFIK